MSRTQQVSILGQTFTIDTEDSPEHVAEVANFISQKVKEIQKAAKSASSLQVAVLAALNTADELIKSQSAQKMRISKAEKKIDSILKLVNSQL